MKNVVLNTRKLYKICFSINPDEFLSPDNQKHLVRMRHNNPRARISLLFSSKLLNPNAQTELKRFCETQRIEAVDFDTTTLALVNRGIHPNNQELYRLAQDELQNLQNDGEGNPDIAAHYAQAIHHVIKLGIYSNWNTEINFSAAPVKIQITEPLIFKADSVNDAAILSFGEYTGILKNEGLINFRNFQENVITTYQNLILNQCKTPALVLKNRLGSMGGDLTLFPSELDNYSDSTTTPRQFRYFIKKILSNSWKNQILSKLQNNAAIANFAQLLTRQNKTSSQGEQEYLDLFFEAHFKKVLRPQELTMIMGDQTGHPSPGIFSEQFIKYLKNIYVQHAVLAQRDCSTLVKSLSQNYNPCPQEVLKYFSNTKNACPSAAQSGRIPRK